MNKLQTVKIEAIDENVLKDVLPFSRGDFRKKMVQVLKWTL